MLYQFPLPDIGEGLTEATVHKWYVSVGSEVQEDQPLCEIETDKAVVEITSPCTGRVVELRGTAGQILQVGATLAVFEMQSQSPPLARDVAQTGSRPTEGAQPAGDCMPVDVSPGGRETPRASPSTRHFANTVGIDLAQVSGSGPGRRVLRDDLEAVIRTGHSPLSGYSRQIPARAFAPTIIAHVEGQTRVPLTGLRKTIAAAMVRSVALIPHATSFFRCNAERFVELHRGLQDTSGSRISLTAMAIKAMVPALRKYPYFNSSIDEAAGEIVLHGQMNVGVATHTADGLLVPVVKEVERKGLAQISQELDQLTAAARERKIPVESLRGATITLSNVGSHGTADAIGGRPIINHPQAAIIVLTRVKSRPVVDAAGRIVAQQCLDIGTSYDHRIIDGIYAALFMETFINVIEDPISLRGE